MEKDMNDVNLQIEMVEIRMNGEEQPMCTTIRTNILVHIATSIFWA